ncbi:oligopeptide transport ATP-binding protein OppF [Mesobacillus boroniphilus JCM 21738]|uniref:Oligopeptide transport ATP-binding protein OppF n=1 Tax=Mesobacillus boroniphilus JCM 21738 TaxID=1294265 RepID=W4RK62_9BACI|nr:oligopeptide transport ATP-binding protein OppF [Mesobacillus boroniphilus JCM 21738]
MENEVLLSVRDLKKHFTMGKNEILKAVDGISFDIYKGETFGLVGESGCGKSTAGRTMIGLYDRTDGEVVFNGKDVHSLSEKEKFQFHKQMQMIFQDPYASLNPRSTVKEIISEPMEVHGLFPNKKERSERIYQLLEDVGLNRDHANRYPHEFSGGQRQRIGIARALALDPDFIIADEPISALDVSVQAQVVNLLKRLQEEKGLTYLFIAHDLSMVKQISDRIGVMYLGHIVELTASNQLYNKPLHPYTQALLSAILYRIRMWRISGSVSSCRENCQVQWIRRAAVSSEPDASTLWTSVPRRNLSGRRSTKTIMLPVIYMMNM